MSNSLSLDQARSQAREKFSDFVVDLSDGTSVTLRSPMQLNKEQRNEFNKIRETLKGAQDGGDDEQSVQSIYQIFRVVADDLEAANKLIDELENDAVSTTMVVLEAWQGAVGTGEA